MPTQDFGVYPDSLTEGTQVSSTYEGRHVTMTAAELLTSAGSGVATKGLPCIFGIVAGNIGVGVCFNSGTTTDLIAIDTEGIWNLLVSADNDDGTSHVTGGDRIYINVLTGILSKISNAVTQVPFGYALGQVAAGADAVIAVKVHFDSPLTNGFDRKSFDHVRGTAAVPIVWGTDTSDVESMYMTTGVMTDYISGLFMRAYAEAATPAGGIQGLIYSRITAEDDVQDMYAIRGRTDLVMDTPGAHIANMVVGGMFSATLDNAGAALTLADRIKAIDCSIGQTATSTITTGSICGMYVAMNGIQVDNAGRTAGIYIYQGGGGTAFPDYGIHIVTESANVLAAIFINSLNQDTPAGIEFETSGGFGYVSLLEYDGPMTAANCEYFMSFAAAAGAEGNTMILEAEGNNDADADFAIRVRLAGDGIDRVIRLYEE